MTGKQQPKSPFPLLQFLLGSTACNGRTQDIGHGLHEIGVVLREGALLPGVGAQDAKRLRCVPDDDTEPADHVVLQQQRRPVEAGLGAQVVDDDGLLRPQGVARLGIEIGPDFGMPHVAALPADARPKQQSAFLRQQLQHFAVVHVERFPD